MYTENFKYWDMIIKAGCSLLLGPVILQWPILIENWLGVTQVLILKFQNKKCKI